MSEPVSAASLLVRWEQLREQGQPITAEELCRDCPQLIGEVRKQIQVLQSFDRVIGSLGGVLPDRPPNPRARPRPEARGTHSAAEAVGPLPLGRADWRRSIWAGMAGL